MLLPLRPDVTVIIPTLDEESGVARAVHSVAGVAEVIVVDGGSRDRTVAGARGAGARGLGSPPGRAVRILDVEGALAGAFRLSIEQAGALLRGVQHLANLRSRLLSLPYGDQALFLRRETFEQMGGFPITPVMEDYAFVRRVARAGRVLLSDLPVVTSARRWSRRGVIRTTVTHQAIVIGWHLGVSARWLARWR